MAAPIKALVSAMSDIGKKRSINEDCFFLSKNDGLFIVADGMGGHLAGDMASKIAVDTIASFIRSSNKDTEMTWPYERIDSLSNNANKLNVAIKLANKKIYTASYRKNLEGMGTTIVALFWDPNDRKKLQIGHVGDSRVYRIRSGKIEQLTRDHSLLNDSIEKGTLSKEEIKNFPFKNIITRALGIDETVEVDLKEITTKKNDIFILCSDGLSNPVSDKDMQKKLKEVGEDIVGACRGLINQANDSGGHDNITLIIIKIL